MVAEMVQNQGRNISGSANDFFNLDRNFWQISSTLSPTPSGASSEFRSRKYSPVIAQLNYSYKDKYLLTGSFRRDGSSDAFGPTHQYGNFPAFSVGWRVSEEPFFKSVKGINDLKIRYGYGILGNDNISPLGFLTLNIINNDAAYPINGSNTSITPGVRHQTIGNPNIKWEQTATSTLGIDATFLNNKMNVSLDLYNRNTTDLLFEKEIDPSIYGGRIERQPINIGSMNNKGIDLALSYHGTPSTDFRYDISTTFSLYKNKVGKLADPFFEGDRTRIDPFNRSVPGRPLSSFFGYQVDGFLMMRMNLLHLIKKANLSEDGSTKIYQVLMVSLMAELPLMTEHLLVIRILNLLWALILMLTIKASTFPPSFIGRPEARLRTIPATGQISILSRETEPAGYCMKAGHLKIITQSCLL
ncbi:MAG: TonB-dependent receptor [Segetibacter sp.]